MGVNLSFRKRMIANTPYIEPTVEEKTIIGSKLCHPNQAPRALKSLKSPWPIPSFFLTSLYKKLKNQREV
jgi:hypothetical protein